ncbi:uncharacterized protein LOC112552713 [Pogonomyrmex barbatus]|uniref:Uncharacterized protein LOC112552713 n=1 Tax=Pogonomyrmex barbatus TaxID=144034 RepID=A0A8N1S8A2_9HYME|nr:uncharacterized protein LOC112552713 [Pogonomyrmex barbatus]
MEAKALIKQVDENHGRLIDFYTNCRARDILNEDYQLQLLISCVDNLVRFDITRLLLGNTIDRNAKPLERSLFAEGSNVCIEGSNVFIVNALIQQKIRSCVLKSGVNKH